MQPGSSTYTTSTLDGLHHWAGQGDYADRRSEEGFASIEAAASDVIFWLHRANDYDRQAAHALVQALGLP